MSGRKNIILPYRSIEDGDMSGNLVSNPTNLTTQDNVGLQFVYTGSPTGDLSVEGSIDGQNWSTMTLIDSAGNPQQSIPLTGSPGNSLVSIPECPYSYLRTRYTFSSGTGVLNSWIASKSI